MTEADAEGADPVPARDESKLYIGQQGPSVWREDMQIANPMSEGLSACGLVPPSPPPFTRTTERPLFLLHPISHRLQAHPIPGAPRAERRPPMQSRGAPRPRHRARLEHDRQPRAHGRNHVRGVPSACILHREHRRIERVRLAAPLLCLFGTACDRTPSSFAAGKGSALVIDIGHSTASVTPVVDGFVLRKGIPKNVPLLRLLPTVLNDQNLIHRPRPLGSPPARARTRETHPDHGEPQPPANPTFLPPAYRKQNRAYILNSRKNTFDTSPASFAFHRSDRYNRKTARGVGDGPALHRAGRPLRENDSEPRVVLRKPRSGRMDTERRRCARPGLE